MRRVTIDELNRELAATDEAYVRHKLNIGGYTPSQAKHVQACLIQRDRERVAEREAHTLAVSRRTAFWTMVAAISACGALVIALITALAAKIG